MSWEQRGDQDVWRKSSKGESGAPGVWGHADRYEGPACLLGEMGSTEGLGRGITMIQLTTKNESAGSGL